MGLLPVAAWPRSSGSLPARHPPQGHPGIACRAGKGRAQRLRDDQRALFDQAQAGRRRGVEVFRDRAMDRRDRDAEAGRRVAEPGALALGGAIRVQGRQDAAAPGGQDACDLGERSGEVVEVLGHQPHDDQVERPRPDRQGCRQRVPCPEDAIGPRLAPRAIEHLRRGVEPHHGGHPGRRHRQGMPARPAPEVEGSAPPRRDRVDPGSDRRTLQRNERIAVPVVPGGPGRVTLPDRQLIAFLDHGAPRPGGIAPDEIVWQAIRGGQPPGSSKTTRPRAHP